MATEGKNKRQKKRVNQFMIDPRGGMSTRELFESHGIAWSEEYEEDEMSNQFGDTDEMENNND